MVHLSDSIRFSDSVSGEVERGNTGRRSGTTEDNRRAKEWAQLPADQLAGHAVVQEFAKYVAALQPLKGDTITCVRGRCSTATISGWEQMGPGHGPNRYNRAGTQALYLCEGDNGDMGVAFELAKWCASPILQDYRVPLSGPGAFLLADFRRGAAHPELVREIFDHAECGDEPTPVFGWGRHDLELSRVVGDIIAQHFAGVLVPGVRGYRGDDEEGWYSNVVIFRPAEADDDWWQALSMREPGFRPPAGPTP